MPCKYLIIISIPTGTIKRKIKDMKPKNVKHFNSYWYD